MVKYHKIHKKSTGHLEDSLVHEEFGLWSEERCEFGLCFFLSSERWGLDMKLKSRTMTTLQSNAKEAK